jgi:hypothetical protein
MPKSIQQWKQNQITLQPNQTFEYNAQSEQTNIFQIINRKASGGGVVFVDIEGNVSATSYMLRVDEGSNQNLVLPYEAKRIFLKTDSLTPLVITIVEISSDDILFTFGAAQLVNISGNVQVQEPVTIDGTVNVSGEMEVKNDSGNPIPVSGTVAISNPVNSVGINNFPVYQSVKVTASGDTVVKVGAGKIIGIQSDGTAIATIRDDIAELWSTTGESQFSAPLGFNTNLTVNLSAAGTCYVIYQ